MDLEQRVGEVIEARVGDFLAQCYQLHQSPPLGSLVKTVGEETEIYAAVAGATTESLDPGRRPLARGRDEESEEDLFRHHPQLAKLFRTFFQARVLGHGLKGRLYHRLPPRPARIHSFVYLCPPEEVRGFTSALDFLNLLLLSRNPLDDEVAAAFLRSSSQAHPDPTAFLVQAGKRILVTLGGDLPRLSALLRGMQP